MKKRFEVELKFRVDGFDDILSQLEELGAEELPENFQCDTYFRHPCKDFKETDEALRIRHSTAGLYVTYKGPKIDKETKTRHEIEFSIGESESDRSQFASLLTSLGFAVAADVKKTRCEYKLNRDGRVFKVALDSVETVGTFVELETECDEVELDLCREAIQQFAQSLNLTGSIRGSYLGMVLGDEDGLNRR